MEQDKELEQLNTKMTELDKLIRKSRLASNTAQTQIAMPPPEAHVSIEKQRALYGEEGNRTEKGKTLDNTVKVHSLSSFSFVRFFS